MSDEVSHRHSHGPQADRGKVNCLSIFYDRRGHEPLVLPEWPDAERRSRLVFSIGMKQTDIEATLTAFSCDDSGTGAVRFPNPAAYSHFVQVAKSFLYER